MRLKVFLQFLYNLLIFNYFMKTSADLSAEVCDVNELKVFLKSVSNN